MGVFIVGYVLSTAVGQVQSAAARGALRTTSDALFPAAQYSQQAESAFDRMVKGFGDAVIMQDAGGLDRAAADGAEAVQMLKSIASIPGLAEARSREAQDLAASLQQLLNDARSTYTAVLSNSVTGAQEQMRSLASRTDSARSALTRTKEQSAAELHQQLASLEATSTNQSKFALAIFLATIALAGFIVHLTIRRSITGPIVRVIGGVESAADRTAQASTKIAQSGAQVSENAQEQAACIQETSASLEEISATTHQNADRAGEADRLMQGARDTVARAAKVIQAVTSSMNVIRTSSNQVGGVLKQIDEIAFHTNILALNAAVEAARAGEAGAGFSVVADEVRSLAQRAADAARTSSATIEQTLGDVTKGVELVNQAHSAFDDLATKITGGTQIVSQIAVSTDEQARGIKNIAQAISRIELLTQRNVANAQETADGASALTAQVEKTLEYLGELNTVVGLSIHRRQVSPSSPRAVPRSKS